MTLLPDVSSSLPHTAAVMFTNHTGAEYVEEAFRRGPHGYVFQNEARKEFQPSAAPAHRSSGRRRPPDAAARGGATVIFPMCQACFAR